MNHTLPFRKSTNSGVSIATSSAVTAGKMSGLKPTNMVKRVCIKSLKATVKTLGVGPFNEISSFVQGFSNICKAEPEYETKYSNLIHQLETDLELVRQVTESPPSSQTVVGDDAIVSLRSGLETILGAAAEIESLHSILKRLNTPEIFERLDQLEESLYHQKIEFAYKHAMMMTMAQARDISQSESLIYEEVLWREISVTESVIYEVKEHESSDQSLVSVKSISKARCRDRDVCFVEYSGTVSRKKKYELLMQDLRQCITGRHANILQLVGGAIQSTATSQPYLVFETGGELDYVTFLTKTTSMNALITFVRGVERGSEYMFQQKVKYRDGISVSYAGVATIHPPGIKLSKLTGKQSTKRWAGHILGDVESEFKDTALPLHELYLILHACTEKKLTAQVEGALMALVTIPKKQHLFEIAERFKVPIKLTWQCVSTPNCPNFVINPASFGTFVGDNSGRSQAPFSHWNPLYKHSPDVLDPRSCLKDWMDKITTRVTLERVSRPTFKDGDIHVMSPRKYPDWLSFENVMRNTRGLHSPCRVVLNYGNRPSTKLDKYKAALDEFIEGSSYPPRVVHFIRGVNLRLIFHVEPNQITMPVYLHRHPCSQYPQHYWGFLSQFADPTIPPESPVSDIKISYQLDVVSALEGDSWGFRVDREHDQHEYAKIPGAWPGQH